MYKAERCQEAKRINKDTPLILTWGVWCGEGEILFGDLGFRASPRGIQTTTTRIEIDR